MGAEFDTDARAPVQRKVGIQIADKASSAHQGTAVDAGLLITRESVVSAGYKDAIRLSNDFGTAFPSTQTVLRATGGTIPTGIDFNGMTFQNSAIALKPGMTNGRIQWGNGNSHVWSDGVSIVIKGGNATSMQIDIEGDNIVFRKGSQCRVLDFDTGNLLSCGP